MIRKPAIAAKAFSIFCVGERERPGSWSTRIFEVGDTLGSFEAIVGIEVQGNAQGDELDHVNPASDPPQPLPAR